MVRTPFRESLVKTLHGAYLLLILRGVGEQSGHVEHYLVAFKHGEYTCGSRCVPCTIDRYSMDSLNIHSFSIEGSGSTYVTKYSST